MPFFQHDLTSSTSLSNTGMVTNDKSEPPRVSGRFVRALSAALTVSAFVSIV